MSKKVVIFGATSAIAYAVAKVYAKEGAELCLVARNKERLSVLQQDLATQFDAKVITKVLDMNEIARHPALIEDIVGQMTELDVALIAHGTLSDQSECQSNIDTLMQEYSTNCLSYLSLLTLLGNYFEKREQGSIVAITSVAGDRGRQSNYVYGSAKAAVTTFLSGLRNRLAKKNVQVLTVKPGFVDTPMTADIKKGVLFAQPEKVADDIVKAIEKKKNDIYTPGFWRLIMMIIKSVPEAVFKRLSL
jgi:decaprenylphospho-beta-D-erythro-pentofuranosid-2-ulose 2-reductase